MFKIIAIVIMALVSSPLWADPVILALPSSQGDEIVITGTGFGSSPGSVKFCNGSTWAKKGICKNQTVTSWTDEEVTIRVLMPSTKNIRKEGVLKYSYLYVVNSTKEAIPNGQKIYLNP